MRRRVSVLSGGDNYGLPAAFAGSAALVAPVALPLPRERIVSPLVPPRRADRDRQRNAGNSPNPHVILSEGTATGDDVMVGIVPERIAQGTREASDVELPAVIRDVPATEVAG